MRIIFIGQAPFGRDCLQALLDQGEEIAGVLTVPDRPGQKGPNPVKELAVGSGLPLLQPARLKDPEVLTWVKNLRPDLLVLAFVTDIVPRAMIDMATCGGINYHPSLLPKYRGGSAMNWAIINGETETGVTIHQIDAGIDTGPIILQQKVAIDPDDTVKSLYFEKLYPLGVQMVAEAVRLIREGKASPVPQDETQASFQPVIKEADVRIDWRQNAQKIYNLIRGSNPNPGAWTTFRGEKLKIWEARPCQAQGDPGTIIEIPGEEGFVIATGEGAILARRVQYGSSPDKILAGQFITAAAIQPGEQVGI
ncbi:Methionyl-tRNA formyltransferase [Moorella glycerini]|uniref:Methionyl-tRNA formyltransferase n=1 Tax=Neomoorella stamsii TaxID=1266720 RepID=A0A9X7P626_9FIRM|nr:MULTISPECIES: methionyl-tRNA formyltransferase [Moorella]PRR72636.1 Methionyl-tRNA formyltransferase [Moorella stamsii]CEP67793.1 Methionyl-tRNA formyltransferase [Moorella glycerini]